LFYLHVHIGIPISLDDLDILMNILNDVAFKWKKIAIQLNLANELGNIQADITLMTGGDGAYLCEILIRWLRQSKKSTLGQLMAALRSESVGEGQLARSIVSKYKLFRARKGNQLHTALNVEDVVVYSCWKWRKT